MRRNRIGGVVLTVTGFLACPCHLIITLPFLATLLAGTALGSFLTHNAGLVSIAAAIYFVVALTLGIRFFLAPARANRDMAAACPPCPPVASERHIPETAPLPEDVYTSGRLERR